MNRRNFLKCAATGLLVPAAPSIIRSQTVVAASPMIVNWVRRVGRNGGPAPSAKTIYALNKFITTLINQGLYQKMVSMVVFVPDSLIAATTPIVNILGSDPWVNTGPFVAADLTSAGLIGDGTTKYLKTGVTPIAMSNYFNVAAFSTFGISVYITSATTNNTSEMGQQTSGGNADSIALFPMFGGTMYWDCPYNGGTGRILCGGCMIGPLNGMACAVRTATNAQACYNYNSTNGFRTWQTGVGNNAGLTPANREFYCLGMNNNGTAQQFSDKRLSFAAFHSGMTSGEAQNFSLAVQQVRTDLGGGFV